MRLSALITSVCVFAAAGGVSLIAANSSVTLIEESSEIAVRDALDDAEYVWAEVEADGLQIKLSGIAPSEALRFQALSTVGRIVDAARIIDGMEVESVAALAPPQVSAEILRNDAGISIIGLIPASTDRDAIKDRFAAISSGSPLTDLLETADYPAPDGWEAAIEFAMVAMERLPRAKVSVQPNYVGITAIAENEREKTRLEQTLNRAAPAGLRLSMEISAPRPVITPFTLRFVKDREGARFDACSADAEATIIRIMSAAQRAGLKGTEPCRIGLGMPSPTWGQAVSQAIDAINELGAGTVTFSDADVTLVAAEGTPQGLFDRVVGELENTLPEVFALYATLPETIAIETGPPEFVATLSPEGLVQLRGRISDDALKRVAESYAQAAFGSDRVRVGARIVEGLPSDWSVRVLASLEALSKLSNGAVTVTPLNVTVSGNTGNRDASGAIASLLAEKLGEAQDFQIDVTYQEKLDPVANLPTPEECEAEIAEVVKGNKITFEPASATIDGSALGTLDDIAEILKACEGIRLEIQGHTDSQGGEAMNAQLSQARAQSVLNELRARRVLTSSFTAKGYGEARPIADNGTEEGREANRRIEFRLLRPEPSVPEAVSPLEELAAESVLEDAPEETEPDAPQNDANEDDGSLGPIVEGAGPGELTQESTE